MIRNDFSVRLAGLERGRNGKLAVRFDVYANRGLSAGHRVMQVTSGAVFASYGAAFKGARRAIAQVEAGSPFPNMSKGF
jgi:hypothetical protein